MFAALFFFSIPAFSLPELPLPGVRCGVQILRTALEHVETGEAAYRMTTGNGATAESESWTAQLSKALNPVYGVGVELTRSPFYFHALLQESLLAGWIPARSRISLFIMQLSAVQQLTLLRSVALRLYWQTRASEHAEGLLGEKTLKRFQQFLLVGLRNRDDQLPRLFMSNIRFEPLVVDSGVEDIPSQFSTGLPDAPVFRYVTGHTRAKDFLSTGKLLLSYEDASGIPFFYWLALNREGTTTTLVTQTIEKITNAGYSFDITTASAFRLPELSLNYLEQWNRSVIAERMQDLEWSVELMRITAPLDWVDGLRNRIDALGKANLTETFTNQAVYFLNVLLGKFYIPFKFSPELVREITPGATEYLPESVIAGITEAMGSFNSIEEDLGSWLAAVRAANRDPVATELELQNLRTILGLSQPNPTPSPD